jgi:hypothetical protein
MKMPIRGKNPPVLRPAPFGKGGHWGIFRRCFERGAAHFHLLCCTDWYMNYFAGDAPDLLQLFWAIVMVLTEPIEEITWDI